MWILPEKLLKKCCLGIEFWQYRAKYLVHINGNLVLELNFETRKGLKCWLESVWWLWRWHPYKIAYKVVIWVLRWPCMVVKVWNLYSPWKITQRWFRMALKVYNLDSPRKVDKEILSQNWISTAERLPKWFECFW